MHDYVITLWNHEDLEAFYDDMETEGGNLYIPDRAVDLVNRREISRNTVYKLTDAESEQIRRDPRVRGVERVDMLPKPEMTYTETRTFTNNFFGNRNGTNYGIKEHTRDKIDSDLGFKSSINNWTDTIDVFGSGKNVDVLIVDGGAINSRNPEFGTKADGTGVSRVVHYNWFKHLIATGSTTYADPPFNLVWSYPTTNNGLEGHSLHVAGIAAGNTTGWAKDANIFNLPFSTTNLWDVIRGWHNSKEVNASTGRRNPTIINGSYGSFITMGPDQTFKLPTSITYRGTTVNRAADANGNPTWTEQELFDRKIMKVYGQNIWKAQFHSISDVSDVEDAINDGIIVVAAAGNDNSYVARDSDEDWNNKLTAFAPSFNATLSNMYYNRPGSISAAKKSIVVGALSNSYYLKASYSQFGPRIDVFAAGTAISAPSFGYNYFELNDPYGARGDSDYKWDMKQGTSMAAPQVAGMLACVLESVPSLTPDEALQLLVKWSRKGEMGGSTSGTKEDYELLGTFYGASIFNTANRIARQPYLRQTTGNSSVPFKMRPASGLTYPRSRVKRRG